MTQHTRNNQIIAVYPYCVNNTWIFDDPSVGLKQEPFVCGIPEIIDRLVAHIPYAKLGFELLGSRDPFPGYQACLTLVREEYGGNWYKTEMDGKVLEGWLCPALFKYFEEAPERLYVAANPFRNAIDDI